ncbi:methyltransferase domain-containing protein [Candidatus Sumerlaeota bacterium]|nr:methyltransferase domain-containing protein [Candidatus Sumerlaeota bacterium]
MTDHIKQHWDRQAETHGDSYAASWGDLYAIQLEIETIGTFLHPGDKVLDVGCGNGHSTLAQAQRGIGSIVGVDYSEKMIEQARQREISPDCAVSFEVGDVRDLAFDHDRFDVVYTTRVLINLPIWDAQVRGIDECLRVCRPGGTVVLSEAFWEPLALLNALRALKRLPPLVEHDFNRYIKKERLERLLAERGLAFEVVDFSSIYYLGSRFLRELVTNPEDYPGYSNPINEIFFNIEKEYSGGGLGIQQAYAIRKK